MPFLRQGQFLYSLMQTDTTIPQTHLICRLLHSCFNTSMTDHKLHKDWILQAYCIRLDCFCYFVHLPYLCKLIKLLTSSLVTTQGGIAMRKAKLWHAVRELPVHLQHVCDQLHLSSRHGVCTQALKRSLSCPE